MSKRLNKCIRCGSKSYTAVSAPSANREYICKSCGCHFTANESRKAGLCQYDHDHSQGLCASHD